MNELNESKVMGSFPLQKWGEAERGWGSPLKRQSFHVNIRLVLENSESALGPDSQMPQSRLSNHLEIDHLLGPRHFPGFTLQSFFRGGGGHRLGTLTW